MQYSVQAWQVEKFETMAKKVENEKNVKKFMLVLV